MAGNIKYYKGYVQEIIPDLKQLFLQNPKLLLCGNQSAMGREVFDTIEKHELLTKEKVSEMKENGDIMMELWGE